MHVRPYQPSDLSTMADIMALCNRTDSLSRFMTRDIDRYPFTYRKGALRFLKGMLLTPGTLGFVAESDAADYGPSSDYDFAAKGPEVVAHAFWHRHGTSEKAREWQRRCNGGWWDSLNRMLTGWEGKYQRTWPFSLAEHTFDHKHFRSIAHVLNEPWDQEVFGEAWELSGLFTRNEWQRKGLGKMLVEWGKERAREEGVPLIVSGSPVGGVAYRAMGFEEVHVLGLGKAGRFDELEYGGEVMRRWCWEPNEEGRWVERARENRRRKEDEKESKNGKVAVKETDQEGPVGITMGVAQ